MSYPPEDRVIESAFGSLSDGDASVEAEDVRHD